MRRPNNVAIKHILGIKESISNKFHRKTSITSLISNTIPYEEWPTNWKKVHYKEYPRFDSLDLNPKDLPPKRGQFESILSRRRSERNFSRNQALDVKSLGQLLNLSAGINNINQSTHLLLRAWPSAGARYPLECYILNNNIDGLEGDFSYHYNVKRISLEKLFLKQNISKFFIELTGQEWTKNASCIVVVTAVFGRTKIKYGDRGYRYCLLDCGHLAQNILLTCTYLNLKACPIGGFSDKQINDFLDLDGLNEAALYLIAIGK